jgi:hypothetical protein
VKVCARHEQAFDRQCPYCEPTPAVAELRAFGERVASPPQHVVDLRPLAPGFSYDANGSEPARTALEQLEALPTATLDWHDWMGCD